MSDVRATENSAVRWYLKPVPIIIAILIVGPLALPLVWLSPALKNWHKVAISILVILFTVWFVTASAKIYESLAGQIRELQDVM